jgi:hypothetical protein
LLLTAGLQLFRRILRQRAGCALVLLFQHLQALAAGRQFGLGLRLLFLLVLDLCCSLASD